MVDHSQLADIIRDHLDKTETEQLGANDEVHKFTAEGSGNTTCSLSDVSFEKLEKCYENYGLMQFNANDNNNSTQDKSCFKHKETGFDF